MEHTEFPDFLRFNKHGTILTPDERRRVAEARGVCITCGQVTHRVTAFRRKPLENEHVHNGICLICNAEERAVVDWKKATNNAELMTRRRDYDSRRKIKAGDGKNKLIKAAKSLKVVSSAKSSPVRGKRQFSSAPDINEDASQNVDGTTTAAAATSIPKRSMTVDSTSSQNDAWDILREMRSNPQDIQLLTQKCHELGQIQSTSEGSMYEILEVMNRFPSEIELQRSGLLALWSFILVGGNDVKLEAVDADIIDVVLQSLEIDNEEIACLGMGVLSCLAEGLGVRGKLLEEEAVEVVEKMLRNSLEGETYNAELLYWILRCLVSLLAVSKEHEDFVKENTFVDCELLEDLEAIDDIKEVLLRGDTVHNVLLAMQETDDAECQSLQLGMEFLMSLFSSCNYARCNEKDEEIFIEMCQKAVAIDQPQLFPTMKSLACTCLCFLLNSGSTESSTAAAKQILSVDGFINAAVDVVRMKRQKDEIVRDVMMCTLSHIFYCKQTINNVPHSNSILRACLAGIAKEKTNPFIQETCMWILWGILAAAHEVSPGKSLVKEVLDVAKQAMADPENTNLITLGIAIVADIAVWHRISGLEDTLQIVLDVQSKYSEHANMVAEANRFIANVCKSKKIAALIESKGAGVTSVDLQYKLTMLNSSAEISLDELKGAIEVWNNSNREPNVAAKILYLLAKRTHNVSAASAKLASVAIEFIIDVLRHADNEELHNYACMTLCSIAMTYLRIKALNGFSIRATEAIMEAQHYGLKQLRAIWVLMTLDAEISYTLLNDLVLYLVNAISEHFNSNKEIVSASIVVLSIVLWKSRPLSQTNRTTIERAIGAIIRVMYECLDQAGNSPQIFLYGLRCLRLCAVDAFLHDCIVKEGGIVAIIDGMNVNYDNEQVQEEGSNIIRHIACGSIETKMLIIEADGLDVVLNILFTFGTHAKLVSEAFDIALYVSISSQVRSFIVNQGGLVMITTIMSTLDDAVVQEKALKALSDLISDIDNDLIEMTDLASAVTATVFNHLSEASIQEVGIAILRNLSKRSESTREKLLSSGCCDTVITAITIHMVSTFLIFLHQYPSRLTY
jgi:hypothetical protein